MANLIRRRIFRFLVVRYYWDGGVFLNYVVLIWRFISLYLLLFFFFNLLILVYYKGWYNAEFFFLLV